MESRPDRPEREAPVCIDPVHSTPSANQAIVLYEGPMELEQGETIIPGQGRIQFKWLPRPAVRFRFEAGSDDATGIDVEPAKLRLVSIAIEAEASVLRVQCPPGDRPTTASGLVRHVEIGSGGALAHALFHLVNFRDFFGRAIGDETGRKSWAGRAVVEAEGWRITIDKIDYPTKIFEELKEGGGYAITHVGKLEMADGRPFTAGEMNDLLEALFRYLSFCRGIWVAPVLAVGFNAEGDRVFEHWRGWKIERWHEVGSWFNDFSAEGLTAGFPGFLRRWRDETWNEPLKLSLHWYGEASMAAGGAEGAVILAQAAFELLAWTLLVEDRRVLSEMSFQPGKLPAMDKMRLLISHCGIPLAIPADLTHLTRIAKAENWLDGPQVLAEYRNALVHANPKKRKKVLHADLGLRYEARSLSLWYLELVLLWLFGYSGSYSNRLRRVGYRGEEVEPVPWAA